MACEGATWPAGTRSKRADLRSAAQVPQAVSGTSQLPIIFWAAATSDANGSVSLPDPPAENTNSVQLIM